MQKTGDAAVANEAASVVDPSDSDEVWSRYVACLQQAHSPLLDAGAAVQQQLRRQLDAVLGGVAVSLGRTRGATSRQADQLSETIGRSRALAGVHPAQSLEAAAMIFEAALPTVIQWGRQGQNHSDTASAAAVLNREILRRMSLAASAYVEMLLERIHDSNQLERRSLSRGLHDVIAPAVALGIQNLELYEVYRTEQPQRAAAKLNDARQTMVEAVSAIRGLSEYLRVDISEHGLTGAIQKFLDAVPSAIDCELRAHGAAQDVPPAYAQEIFLIVREAIRNAVEHAAPARITVDLEITPSRIISKVADNGSGFDQQSVLTSDHHVGLDSMRERAELLSASFSVVTNPGEGTMVHLAVPRGGSASAS